MKHLSLRLAWHQQGWNGHICKSPKANTYCIGSQSYPGSLIAERRNLSWEGEVAGQPCLGLDGIPPCSNSINAFGLMPINNVSYPPAFFNSETKPFTFEMPPATACTWPYEEMYNEPDDQYNYDKKRAKAVCFFEKLTANRSLIFYYANKSNPFSDDDNKNYVLVGIARLKSVGEIMCYEGTDDRVKKRYGGGFIWQMPVTSAYPDEGFCIPYHKYADRPEILEHLLYIPEQSNNFKYAARHIEDDDALIYIEHLLSIVQYLLEIGDDTENWTVRKEWLQSLMAELWENRGPYPGLPSLLDYLGCKELIPYYFQESKEGNSKPVAEEILCFLEDRSSPAIASLDEALCRDYHKKWATRLMTDSHRRLAKLLVRAAVTKDQIEWVMSDQRIQNGLSAGLPELADNIYLLCEQYLGNDAGDQLTFNKIDHAAISSPELGLVPLYPKDDWRRLRALLVDVLKYETVHSFVDEQIVLERVNKRLEFVPEWKKEVFNKGHIDYDLDKMEQSIVFQHLADQTYLYLKQVYEDERLVEEVIKDLVSRQTVQNKPFSEQRWHDALYQRNSSLARKAPEKYEEAIGGQIETCVQVFNKGCSVVAGSAGTGKTTLIRAIIQAIKSTSNQTERIALLAPTGKAADRIRQKTDEEAMTIHAFLTKTNWMNYNNWTLKRSGGTKCDQYTTYIIDESSMIDLHLMACLFRSIDWNAVRRMIFVGDPNQLPPIGRGKVFAEIIGFLKSSYPENYGKLAVNLRQMENRISNAGTGILDLAALYIGENSEKNGFAREAMLKKIQDSDEDVFPDLRIVTWNDADELERKLRQRLLEDYTEQEQLTKNQIISPYRGEFYGTDYINTFVQDLLNGKRKVQYAPVVGITSGDRIIQIVNRANTTAYKVGDRRVDVFNGELGVVTFCNSMQKTLTVQFDHKSDFPIRIKGEAPVENNLELGYAISVHKSQGSEFERIYLILPKSKQALLSSELLYTGITRAQKHLTIFVEGDFRTLYSMMRPEKSKLAFINSSVFGFHPLDNRIMNIEHWYEEGKIHATLSEYFVRSKSEVIIANLLFDKGLESFQYEMPLYAEDGTCYLPDFTIQWRGRTYYWEHLGMIDERYKEHWEKKKRWYEKHFPGSLITTTEGTDLTVQAEKLIRKIKRQEI